MRNSNKLEQMLDPRHGTRIITLRPGTSIGNYEATRFLLIVDDDFKKMFPSQVTEFTMISSLQYDVFKDYFPTVTEDSAGVKCIIPVEEQLAKGEKLPPRAYINMAFSHDPELFKKYTEDTSIRILGAQFCPIDKLYREEFEMGDTEFIPLGMMNITCSWKYNKRPFTVSQFICMRKDTHSYEFRLVYKIDSIYQIMLVHHDSFFNSNSSEFNDDIYRLFKDIIPCISRESMRLWDAIQYMSLHPKLKEVFFSEEAPAPSYARKPIRSGMDLRKQKARNNVKYVHLDVSKHNRTIDEQEKRKYTKPTEQVPYKGHFRRKPGSDEEIYIQPGIRYKNNPPIKEPKEVKLA